MRIAASVDTKNQVNVPDAFCDRTMPGFPCPPRLLLALMSCGSQPANGDRNEKAGAAEMSRSAPIQPEHLGRPSDPRSALAVIRTEWTECRDQAFGPAPLQECDDRASDASNALLPRSGASPVLEALEADLFEPLMNRLTDGGFRSATQVSVIYSFAELAQRRAAILTGASSAPLVRERVQYSLASLLRRLATPSDDVLSRMIGPRADRSWLRRWLAIRNEDCAAYPVPQCAVLLDGAFRGMLHDNLSAGGERRLPALRR